MSRDEGRPVESRERILDAALEEFGMRGYDAASTNRVCQQAEISKGLLFHYYSTKQHLFAEVLERCIGDLESAGDLSRPFDEVCQCQLFFFLAHPFHRRLIADLLVYDKNSADARILTLQNRVVRLKREQLRRALADCSLRPDADPEVVLELLVAVTDHLQNKYLKQIAQGRVELAEVAAAFGKENRQVLSMILNGIVTTPVRSAKGGAPC